MTKSIIVLASIAMTSTPAAAQAPVALDTYQTMTRVEPRCAAPREGREIVVCGRRRADRWRVPFLLKEAGDPAIQNVSAERNLLASEPRPTCGTTAFFSTSCSGMAGLSARTAIGAGAGVTLRPLAD